LITQKKRDEAVARALTFFETASIALTDDEMQRIEVADFGLGRLDEVGLELLTYVNSERVCAKELILFPWQICPEHRHPAVTGEPGKEETFRCRWGEVYLYVPGPRTADQKGKPPADLAEHMTVWHEVILRPGDQYTLSPDTRHWFQGGPEGAVVSEFSTRSRDESDIFTDPRIERETVIDG